MCECAHTKGMGGGDGQRETVHEGGGGGDVCAPHAHTHMHMHMHIPCHRNALLSSPWCCADPMFKVCGGEAGSPSVLYLLTKQLAAEGAATARAWMAKQVRAHRVCVYLRAYFVLFCSIYVCWEGERDCFL